MVSLPSGFAAAGTDVATAVVGAGTLVADDPLLGAWVASDSDEDPQATATISIIAVSIEIRNGMRKIRLLAIVPPQYVFPGELAILACIAVPKKTMRRRRNPRFREE